MPVVFHKKQDIGFPIGVDTVLVVPKNLRSCHYYINESDDPHSKSYMVLRDYLIKLIPTRALEFDELLSKFKTFLVVVASNQVIELEVPKVEEDSRTRIQGQLDAFLANPHKTLEKQENRDSAEPGVQTIFDMRKEILGSNSDKPILNPNHLFWGQR